MTEVLSIEPIAMYTDHHDIARFTSSTGSEYRKIADYVNLAVREISTSVSPAVLDQGLSQLQGSCGAPNVPGDQKS
jgi:hypothetical protein